MSEFRDLQMHAIFGIWRLFISTVCVLAFINWYECVCVCVEGRILVYSDGIKLILYNGHWCIVVIYVDLDRIPDILVSLICFNLAVLSIIMITE